MRRGRPPRPAASQDEAETDDALLALTHPAGWGIEQPTMDWP